MKYLNLQVLTDLFYKLSIIKFPEETAWVPKQLSEHKLFKDYPHDKLQKVFKDYGLDDFRTKIDSKILKASSFNSVYSVMQTNILESNFPLTSLIKLYAKVYGNQSGKIEDDRIVYIRNVSSIQALFYNILDVMKKNNSATLKLPTSIRTEDKRLKYDAGASIIKVYNDINSKLNKVQKEFGKGLLQTSIVMPSIETSDAFSALSNAQYNFELVFSTNLMDLVGISDRGISSCQSLHDEATQCTRITQMNQQLIGTILSRYIGVVYITSGKNESDRGEQMIYRALVRQVASLETDDPAIYVDQIYPAPNDEIDQIMKRELQKHSKIPVISSGNPMTKSPGERYYVPDEENIPEEQESYRDPGVGYTREQLLRMKTSPDFKKRAIAAEKLPIDDIMDMIHDSSGDIRDAVIDRLAREKGYSSMDIYKLQDPGWDDEGVN